MMAAEVYGLDVRTRPDAWPDLLRRLAAGRRPEQPVHSWELGVPWSHADALRTHWLHEYPRHRLDEKLCSLDHVVVHLGDERIHAAVARSTAPGAIPLLLTHGWPTSPVQFLDVIGRLADPPPGEVAFHVVAPSLPGIAWSHALARSPHTRAIAELWVRVMREGFGFDRFVTQGGDFGALVSTWLGIDHPNHVMGIHVDTVGLRPPTGPGVRPLDAAEQAWLGRVRERRADAMAYANIHATRPGTIGIALNDSPLGLASWMLEKLHEWSPTNDHALANDHDTVIDNVLPYWTTSCAASAAGLYRAEAAGPRPTQFEVVPVPTHFLRPHCDLVPAPPTSWMKRLHPELTVEDRKDGGHFAALEDPETFVDSVRAFAAGLR